MHANNVLSLLHDLWGPPRSQLVESPPCHINHHAPLSVLKRENGNDAPLSGSTGQSHLRKWHRLRTGQNIGKSAMSIWREWICALYKCSVNQSINQSVNQSINESISQSITEVQNTNIEENMCKHLMPEKILVNKQKRCNLRKRRGRQDAKN
jgi:hypothetical protein